MIINNKRVFIGIGIIVAIIIVWFIINSFDRRDILNLDSKGTNIVAFGDSLVQGVGATGGHDFISLLSRQIGLPIVNLGRSGDTTAQALTRIDSVFEYDPRIVIVLLGGNDFLKKIPPDETFANMDRIVQKIQDNGSAVLILGVRGGLLYDSYDSRYETFALQHKTAFVPNVLKGLIGDMRYMSDAIHPNDTGYALVAAKVLPVLNEMLTKSSKLIETTR